MECDIVGFIFVDLVIVKKLKVNFVLNKEFFGLPVVLTPIGAKHRESHNDQFDDTYKTR